MLLFLQLSKEYVTYENEIFFSKRLRALKNPADSSNDIDRCVFYPDPIGYLLLPSYLNECKLLIPLVLQGDDAVYISSVWTVSPLLGVQV